MEKLLTLKDEKALDFSCSKLSQPIVLIPAYKPENILVSLVRDLINAEVFQAVVIINDGSGVEYNNIFAELSVIPSVQVLSHEVNYGKGAALKTGLVFIEKCFGQSIGVITADADGQHDLKDIFRIALELSKAPREMILGARSFKGNIPFRSRFGNELTRHVLSLFSYQKLQDSQTGLRAIPAYLIGVFAKLRPNGYDYELDMLITSKKLGITIKEIGIRTIYIDGNKSSHFKPVLDSLRIYSVFLRFGLASILSALLDNFLFITAFWLGSSLLLSQIFGRSGSLLFNYVLNKRAVFNAQTGAVRSLKAYLALAIFLFMASYSLIHIAVYAFNINALLAKICVESLLFLMSFGVQKSFVFKAIKHPVPGPVPVPDQVVPVQTGVTLGWPRKRSKAAL